MPELSRFLGIIIYMYFDDHNPPHFHAEYSGCESIFYINPLEHREGNLPPRVVGLVMEWAELHKDELLNNWNSLTETGNYSKIAPLV
ncbi:MAG: DUF4160 domain-containing protein [Treponema sp.]|nr:DUF4160 domain-containing protein [Treponema sp.]